MHTKQLADTLQNLPAPGDYYSTGSLEIFPPTLNVNQVGRISFPLLPAQMEQLINVAERAPYGKGSETLVDTDVRRTWQIDASRIEIGGKYWQQNLNEIVDRVKTELGVDCEVSAELYKLLVYDTGSFFVSHRDTEKSDGMFATLIIVLPSLYSGGELLVSHREKEVKLDLSHQDAEMISFAAFYADCLHEVLPVTDGCRLTLIYNLIRSDKKIPLPTPPDYFQTQQKTAAILKHWAQCLNENTDGAPDKLIFLLEHAYSIAELSFDTLKNRDAAAANVLIPAAKQADCDLYLALVSIEESGSAEYTGYGYNHWDEEDEDEFEIGEAFDYSETISEWRSIDGGEPDLPVLPFVKEEFCPPESFDAMGPGEIEFQEATGNAGASYERMYHCAALVLWPRKQYLSVINQAGLHAALPVLKNLCLQWKSSKKTETKNEAKTLAGYLLKDWFPKHCAQSNGYSSNQFIIEFIKCLRRIGDAELIKRFWLIIAEKGVYKKEDGLALVQISSLLPWSDIVSYATNAITVSAVQAPGACIVLLAALSNKREQEERQQLNTAAQTLFLALPGDVKRFPDLMPWQHKNMALSAEEVADILVCFSMIIADLAEQTLDYMLAWPEMYGTDKILLPAALHLAASSVNNELPAVQRLRGIVMTHLQSRLAEPLAPQADWSRGFKIKCSCANCSELKHYLKNPGQAQWRFKAVEAHRSHIEHMINLNRCDVDYVTEKKSRPYTLVCTKNRASYQRRVKQSHRDQEALAHLEAVN